MTNSKTGLPMGGMTRRTAVKTLALGGASTAALGLSAPALIATLGVMTRF